MPSLADSFNSSVAPDTPVMTVDKDGAQLWQLPNGELHREDGPALERTDGDKYWYRYGQLHREDGPAVVCANNSYKEWWLNGELHREDGPAYEGTDGTKEWCLNGVKLTEAEFNARREEQAQARQTAINNDLATFRSGLAKPLVVMSGKLSPRFPPITPK